MAMAPMPQPGATAPATVPGNSLGMQMRGRIEAALAMKLLESALAKFGSTSDEGGSVLKALQNLSKSFGQASGDLTRQEVKLAGERAAGVETPGPQSIQSFQDMIRRGNAARLGSPAAPAAPPMPEMAGAAPGGM